MLDSLSQRLSKIVKTMRGQARLTEENTKDMLREVRIALLEADVALPVVREVLARIKEKAMGEEVVGNLNPGQALVGVVQRELTAIIGGDVPAAERDIFTPSLPLSSFSPVFRARARRRALASWPSTSSKRSARRFSRCPPTFIVRPPSNSSRR